MLKRAERKNLILELVDRYAYLEESTTNKKVIGNKDYKIYQMERKNHIGSTKVCVDFESLVDAILYIGETSNSSVKDCQNPNETSGRNEEVKKALIMIYNLFDESEIPALLEELGKSNFITLTVAQINKNETIKKSVISLSQCNSAFVDTSNL